MFDKYCRMEYRDDIQGIRALGAILIMIFHIWVNKVSGGVDVFFVISGFLMSFMLLRGYFKENTINPLFFWGGIAKRIAPSAYVVLSATLVLSYFFSSPYTLHETINEIVISSLHAENLQLIRKSVDYLRSDGAPSPVQQFWALSIQVQFYLFLPLVLIPLAYTSKRLNNSIPLILGVAIIAAISFVYSIVATHHNPFTSYFNPIARVWEFLIGVLTFLFTSNIKETKYKNLLGLLGVMLIFGGALLIPKEASFPGFIALIPVTGAVLILMSGVGGFGFTNKILSSKPLVLLGGISFTIYLWHWPILIFYKEHYGYNSVGVLQGFFIILLSTLLAYITSRSIEMKFNKLSRDNVMINFTIAVLFLMPVLLSSLIVKNKINKTITVTIKELRVQEIPNAPINEKIKIEKNVLLPDRNIFLSTGGLTPSPLEDECSQKEHGSEVKYCRLGKVNSKNKIVLAGSSHAEQWLPALEFFGEKNDFEVISMTKDYCPLGPLDDSNKSCYEWNVNVLNKIKEINPYAVITNSTKTERNDIEHIPYSFVEAWKELNELGIVVIGIRDNPRFNFNVPECVYRNKRSPELCYLKRSAVLQEYNPALDYDGLIKNIDMTDMLCTKDICLTTYSGHLIYRDKSHIHLSYVKYIKDQLEYKLKKIMTEL